MNLKIPSTSQDTINLKIVFLGESGVGKTSILSFYLTNSENPTLGPTIGVAFSPKEIIYNSQKLQLLIWDTAGQEIYRNLTPMYYRNATAAIFVFDLTDKNTFDALSGWIQEMNNWGAAKIVIIVGNKKDLMDSRLISRETAVKFAKQFNAGYIETSAVTGEGIERIFEVIVSKYFGEIEKEKKVETIDPTVQLTVAQKNSRCC